MAFAGPGAYAPTRRVGTRSEPGGENRSNIAGQESVAVLSCNCPDYLAGVRSREKCHLALGFIRLPLRGLDNERSGQGEQEFRRRGREYNLHQRPGFSSVSKRAAVIALGDVHEVIDATSR